MLVLFIERVGFFCKQGLVLVLFIERVGFFLLQRWSAISVVVLRCPGLCQLQTFNLKVL